MNTTVAIRPASQIKLYRFPLSGHSHRVELFLSLLGLPVELIHVDILTCAHKNPEFIALNIFGQVPVLQDGDVTIADSNAILVYLASKYDAGHWLPRDPEQAAEVQRWLSVAAGLLAFGPAAARLVKVFKAPLNLDEVTQRANHLFEVMEKVLQQSPFSRRCQTYLGRCCQLYLRCPRARRRRATSILSTNPSMVSTY